MGGVAFFWRKKKYFQDDYYLEGCLLRWGCSLRDNSKELEQAEGLSGRQSILTGAFSPILNLLHLEVKCQCKTNMCQIWRSCFRIPGCQVRNKNQHRSDGGLAVPIAKYLTYTIAREIERCTIGTAYSAYTLVSSTKFMRNQWRYSPSNSWERVDRT